MNRQKADSKKVFIIHLFDKELVSRILEKSYNTIRKGQIIKRHTQLQNGEWLEYILHKEIQMANKCVQMCSKCPQKVQQSLSKNVHRNYHIHNCTNICRQNEKEKML